MKAERYENGPMMYRIKGVESDMGEGTTLDLVIQNDGDALITLWNVTEGQRLDIEICTSMGGTHTLGLAMKLREVAEYLYNCQQDPQFATREMLKRAGFEEEFFDRS